MECRMVSEIDGKDWKKQDRCMPPIGFLQKG